MAHDTLEPVILLSGGVDSASCLCFYKALGTHPSCLFVDYGQPPRNMERRAAVRIADFYGAPLEVVEAPGILPTAAPGFVRGRNLLLLSIALCASAHAPQIVMGIHQVGHYPDCGPSFVSAAQAVLNCSTKSPVRLAAPFVEWTKNDIWAYAVEQDVPLHFTRSCEAATLEPCGICNSCKDRERLNAGTTTSVHS